MGVGPLISTPPVELHLLTKAFLRPLSAQGQGAACECHHPEQSKDSWERDRLAPYLMGAARLVTLVPAAPTGVRSDSHRPPWVCQMLRVRTVCLCVY